MPLPIIFKPSDGSKALPTCTRLKLEALWLLIL